MTHLRITQLGRCSGDSSPGLRGSEGTVTFKGPRAGDQSSPKAELVPEKGLLLPRAVCLNKWPERKAGKIMSPARPGLVPAPVSSVHLLIARPGIHSSVTQPSGPLSLRSRKLNPPCTCPTRIPGRGPGEGKQGAEDPSLGSFLLSSESDWNSHRTEEIILLPDHLLSSCYLPCNVVSAGEITVNENCSLNILHFFFLAAYYSGAVPKLL